MSGFTSEDVKRLREQTGAGMMSCKEALVQCTGNFEKAVDYLRKKGLAAAEKKQGRIAADGLVGSYIHNGKIGVMIEVNCETDFVAKSSDFQNFVKDMAMQVAATSPKFVKAEDMDEEFKRKEAEIYAAQLKNEGKPEHMIAKIVEGKIKKMAAEVCLIEQPFIKNTDVTVKDLINELTLKLGEKIQVRRFTKFVLGEGIEKRQENFANEIAKMTGQQ